MLINVVDKIFLKKDKNDRNFTHVINTVFSSLLIWMIFFNLIFVAQGFFRKQLRCFFVCTVGISYNNRSSNCLDQSEMQIRKKKVIYKSNYFFMKLRQSHESYFFPWKIKLKACNFSNLQFTLMVHWQKAWMWWWQHFGANDYKPKEWQFGEWRFFKTILSLLKYTI